jgi:hypothetical protein
MQYVLDDPKLWHDCAEDAWVTADKMIDQDSKRLLLGIAAGYRQLALRSEERHAEGPSENSAGAADRLRVVADGAKILLHPSLANRGGQPHD